jgi:DNA-binding NarL/FixJ family response regulator
LIRVRVLAASPVVRAGLEALLARAGDIELLDRSADHDAPADVIISDRAGMLGRNQRADASWRQEESTPLVLLLDDVINGWPDALRSGARAVLSPGAEGDEILAAVHAAATGLLALPPEVAEALLDVSLRRTTTGVTESLSPREREILAMLAEGIGNKTIATRLGISRHTVKAHVSSILAKLDASSRAEAIVIGARMGVIVL